MSKFIDLTGQKFNRLLVLYRVDNVGGRTAYMCKCDCGNEKIIIGKSLKSENTKSCGCYNLEKSKKMKYRRYNKYDLSGEFGIGYTSRGDEFYFDLEDYNKIKDYCWFVSGQGYIESNTLKNHME